MSRTLLPLLLSVSLAACAAPIDGVTTFTYTGGDHRQGRLIYAQTPPVGGPHNPTWQNCGVYTQPLADEHAVHSLEHGAVWVTYRGDVAPGELAALRTLLDGRPSTLLSPHDGLTAPIVISAWNAQLAVTRADDPRLRAFLDRYEQGYGAPERGAPCSGGTSEGR